MNRRGHLSSKIPNVKLRPAPAGRRSTRRNPSPGVDAWDDEEDDMDTPLGSGTKPWTSVVVTFTGVDDKPGLSKLVVALGGAVESALTVKVTHVIASGPGSAKYLYAIEHRLPVMAPSWITEAHKRYLIGDTLDVAESVEAHRLQPFVGLKIAVSGIDLLDRRKQIIRHINAAGGTYSKDLDRSCTHLVSAFPTRDPKAKTSDKIKWALKEIGDREMLRRRGKRVDGDDIRIIYEEWIWDCVAFSGRWKEEGYDARKPRAKGKVTYEQIMDGSAFLPAVEEDKPEEDDEQPVQVKKRKHDTMDNLVGELMSARPLERKATETELKEDGDALPARGGVFERKASVLHASRSTAFAATSGASRGLSGELKDEPASKRQKTPSFFSGLRISHAIAEGYEGLENALHQHNATIVTEQERLAGAPVDYVVVRLSATSHPPMPEFDDQPQPMLVTECWIEACCFRQTLIPPEDNLVFRPLAIDHPIAAVESFVVHISGFSTETRAFLRRLLKALGGTLSEKFNRLTTHLLCADPVGIKYEKAVEWGVPVVSDSWVWAMARSGRLEPVEEHVLENAEGNKEAAAPPPRTTTPLASSTTNMTEESLPASRQLKATPTHIDTKAPVSPVVGRLARGLDSPASASHPASSPRANQLKSTATAPGAKDEVTAALRRLAEVGAPTSSKMAAIRRARPSSSNSRTVAPSASTSPARTKEMHEPVLPPPGPEEESIRVTYADAASEKERRRMLDAVMRGGGGRTSPRKRGAV